MCYQLHQLPNLENVTSRKEKVPPVPKFLSIPTPLSDLENTVIWYSLQAIHFGLIFCFLESCLSYLVVRWHQINLDLIETKCQWLFWFRFKQPFAKSTARNVNHTNWKFWVGRKCKYTKKTKNQYGQCKKVQQMQPMWLYIFSHKPFEATFKNTHEEKSNKCNQCGYAFSQEGSLRRHMKTHSGKS